MDGFDPPHAAPLGAAEARGERVCVAVRPEKFALSETEPEGAVRRLAGEIDAAAYLGERSHFFVRFPGAERPVAVSAQNASRARLGAVERVRKVWLSWADDAPIILDA